MKLMKTVQRREKGKATNFCQKIEGCNFKIPCVVRIKGGT